MAKQFTKTDLARKYREIHGIEMPTLKLARIMYKENNLRFTNIEDARSALRAIEGKKGSSNKQRNKITLQVPNRPLNPYKLPEADIEPFEPYVLKGYKRIALFSDIHVPYHHVEAITLALDFCKKEKPDLLILNGDTLDCFQLSRFDKDPKKRNFAGELDIMKQMIEVFQKVLKCKIIFKKGNHSERYEHFLYTKAKELIGIEEFELHNIINARVQGIDVIGDKRIIHANKLNIIHGHEFSQGFFSPVNVARGLSLRAKASAIQGHSHQSSEHTSIDINGKVMTTWSTGALCQLNPQYAPINNWNLGFAVIDLDENGEDFNVRNKRIYKGKIL